MPLHVSSESSSLFTLLNWRVNLTLLCFLMMQMISSVSPTGACFKCRSFLDAVNRIQSSCLDPFDSQIISHDMRQCPSGENCVKIVGIVRYGHDAGREVVVRDCYKLPSNSYYSYIKDSNIEYYGTRIDGFIHVCEGNYCNKAPSRKMMQMMRNIVFNVIFMSSTSVLLCIYSLFVFS